jgi:GrpB-like predicted nucleotidyltransferase (UPF0157 family)
MTLELEHVGSTAVPGLRAKPIIDMMAAVSDLAAGQVLALLLGRRGYRLIETGMKNRLFLRRRSDSIPYPGPLSGKRPRRARRTRVSGRSAPDRVV